MNLAAYDIMTDINYKKTWIDARFKKLYSYELPKHIYYSFLKRYNIKDDCEDLYIVLYNEEQEIIKNYVSEEKYNISKYKLNDVWDYFVNSVTDIQNVNMILEETQEDCVVYKFELN